MNLTYFLKIGKIIAHIFYAINIYFHSVSHQRKTNRFAIFIIRTAFDAIYNTPSPPYVMNPQKGSHLEQDQIMNMNKVLVAFTVASNKFLLLFPS